MRVLMVGLGVILAGAATASSITDNGRLAMADEQVRAAQVAMQLAPIKSNDQLQRYLAAYPKDLSAFQGVPAEVVEQFASSPTFNGKGLTGFDPTPLKALSASQVYKILALFGLQSGAGRIAAAPRNQLDADVNLAPQGLGGINPVIDFLEGYRCDRPGTCGQSMYSA